MKNIMNMIVLLLVVGPLVNAQQSSKQNGLWKAVAPGLRMRYTVNSSVRSVEYQSSSSAGRETMLRILTSSHVNINKLGFHLKDTAYYQSSGTCTTNYAGTGSISSIYSKLQVNCGDQSSLTGYIHYIPVPNTIAEGTVYVSATNYFLKIVSKQCNVSTNDNGNVVVCNSKFKGEPTDWFIEEGWESSNGQSGYACQAGVGYPYNSGCYIDGQ